jgi:hypothetical protein
MREGAGANVAHAEFACAEKSTRKNCVDENVSYAEIACAATCPLNRN